MTSEELRTLLKRYRLELVTILLDNAVGSDDLSVEQLIERLHDLESVIADKLVDQRRALDHVLGLPVEPMAHYAKAKIVGVLGDPQ
jgi:hypothetical protein